MIVSHVDICGNNIPGRWHKYNGSEVGACLVYSINSKVGSTLERYWKDGNEEGVC